MFPDGTRAPTKGYGWWFPRPLSRKARSASIVYGTEGGRLFGAGLERRKAHNIRGTHRHLCSVG